MFVKNFIFIFISLIGLHSAFADVPQTIKDMEFIDRINFIPIKQLDREYKQISDKMIDIIIPLFKDNFSICL